MYKVIITGTKGFIGSNLKKNLKVNTKLLITKGNMTTQIFLTTLTEM
jgi:nucleoside-diphosphate-sugar epimerase